MFRLKLGLDISSLGVGSSAAMSFNQTVGDVGVSGLDGRRRCTQLLEDGRRAILVLHIVASEAYSSFVFPFGLIHFSELDGAECENIPVVLSLIHI